MEGEGCAFEPYDELDVSHHCLEDDEKFFAEVIGRIEDLLLNENFLKVHTKFMEDHYTEFEDTEENKLAYYEVYKDYLEIIEKHIEGHLMKSVPCFNMLRLEGELIKRQNELDGEVFEILATFNDFISFKEKFLDYKAMKEGKNVDLCKNLKVMKFDIENTKFN